MKTLFISLICLTASIFSQIQFTPHTVTFNASGLSSGIYFYTLNADGFVETKKKLLIK
jgi:hypothetical protein